MIVFAALSQIVVYALIIAIAALFCSFFASVAGALFALAKVLFGGVDDTAEIIVKYPKTQATREGVSSDFDDRLRDAMAPISSSFFEDVDGVDLEYRGVGAAARSAGAAGLGKTVSSRRG